MNALTLQEIIDRIPVHKNIHKSDVVAYCDENRSHAQVLYFPLGYLDFLREKLMKKPILLQKRHLSRPIEQVLERIEKIRQRKMNNDDSIILEGLFALGVSSSAQISTKEHIRD